MAKALKTAAKSAPKQEEAPAPEGNNTEDNDMAARKTAALGSWGSFKVETGFKPARSAAGTSKYDWATFPAPTDPADDTTWTSVFIPDIGPKTIYGSIKAFRDKLQKAGAKTIPEFAVSVSKDPKGVRVIRKS